MLIYHYISNNKNVVGIQINIKYELWLIGYTFTNIINAIEGIAYGTTNYWPKFVYSLESILGE